MGHFLRWPRDCAEEDKTSRRDRTQFPHYCHIFWSTTSYWRVGPSLRKCWSTAVLPHQFRFDGYPASPWNGRDVVNLRDPDVCNTAPDPRIGLGISLRHMQRAEHGRNWTTEMDVTVSSLAGSALSQHMIAAQRPPTGKTKAKAGSTFSPSPAQPRSAKHSSERFPNFASSSFHWGVPAVWSSKSCGCLWCGFVMRAPGHEPKRAEPHSAQIGQRCKSLGRALDSLSEAFLPINSPIA